MKIKSLISIAAVSSLLLSASAFAAHTIKLNNAADMQWSLSGPTDQVNIGAGQYNFIITVDRYSSTNSNPNSPINVTNCELPGTTTPVTTILPGSESYCHAIDATQPVVLTTEGSQSNGEIQNISVKKK